MTIKEKPIATLIVELSDEDRKCLRHVANLLKTLEEQTNSDGRYITDYIQSLTKVEGWAIDPDTQDYEYWAAILDALADHYPNN